MALTPGSRLGPYEILAPLGAGGMGEVYRAKDTRLGRDVAVKVLPTHLAADPDLRARFEREAKAASSLNHPHICTLHDVGREGEVDFLVMELIEGESLAERLLKGPLPLPQALKLGSEIADALDRAHRAGIIHRDLKPGNIMLTRSGAKLMDFGLARATGLAPNSGSSVAQTLTHSPLGQPLTVEGTLVGTFQYMSPEQLEGQEADARSDLWALGCVIYESITGRRAFEGRSQATLISSIIGSQPTPASQVVPMVTPALERLVSQCLAKDPEERWQSARDVGRELDWIARGGSEAGVPAPVAARRKAGLRISWIVAGVSTLVALGCLALLLFHRPPEPVVSRFSYLRPPSAHSMSWPRLSPDGKVLAFLAADSLGHNVIWVRPLSSLEAAALPGTEGAGRPFWSPDSRYLGFFVGNQIRKVPAAGGPAQLIAEVKNGSDGAWGAGDVILFDGGQADSIQQISAQGGEVRPASFLDRKHGDVFHAWPQFLPDGKHFLFLSRLKAGKFDLLIGSVASHEVHRCGTTETRAEFVDPGYAIYGSSGTLMARRLDPGGGKFLGDAFPIAERVTASSEVMQFSCSRNGELAYMPRRSVGQQVLEWVDRTGKVLETVGQPGSYADMALSRDGKKLLYGASDAGSRKQDLWMWDFGRQIATKLTFDADNNEVWPVWSPDGSEICYSGDAGGTYSIYRLPLNGGAQPRLLFKSNGPSGSMDWSPDGRSILITNWDSGVGDVCSIPPESSGKVVRLVASKADEHSGVFSPDGKWFAYNSDESGRPEVYVQPYPTTGRKWQISNSGGRAPAWRADGRELYYQDLSSVFQAVPMTLGPDLQVGAPVRLFQKVLATGAAVRNRYVVSPDGQKFLINSDAENLVDQSVVVVQGWLSEIQRK